MALHLFCKLIHIMLQNKNIYHILTRIASLFVGKVRGSILGSNGVIAKDVNIVVYCCYVRYATLRMRVGGNLLAKNRWNLLKCTVMTSNQRLYNQSVCFGWDLEPLGLLNILPYDMYIFKVGGRGEYVLWFTKMLEEWITKYSTYEHKICLSESFCSK